MFDALQDKLQKAFRHIRGRGILTAAEVDLALKEVRMALLEADVNFKVVKEFCEAVATKAKGEDILKSLTPDQQVIKIVHEELITMLGQAAVPLNVSVAPPAVIVMAGLQGSGKTTTSAKLALHLKKQLGKRPLLVPADVHRPAAVDQLKSLGKQYELPVFESDTAMGAVGIAVAAMADARNRGYDVVIIDTAGRLQIDETLMGELKDVVSQVKPHEILLVCDAMIGQEAVNVAQGFHTSLSTTGTGLTGLVLTKMDGDARGGAALSIRSVTGCPIKFIGTGERADALEVFHPDRLASRILGMGDVLSLIEKASQNVTLQDAEDLQKKFKKNQFTLEDFLGQMKMIRKMGPISSLAGMIPGMGQMAKQIDPEAAEKEMKRIEAIILSMTPKERNNHEILNGSRRKRIANGSGTTAEDINKFLKQFQEMKKMMTQLSKFGLGNMMGGGGKGGLGGLLSGLKR